MNDANILKKVQCKILNKKKKNKIKNIKCVYLFISIFTYRK
jgi:hypothetical protein